jgi:hypothetical protein
VTKNEQIMGIAFIVFILLWVGVDYLARKSPIRITNCVLREHLDYYEKLGIAIDKKNQICGDLTDPNYLSTTP